MGQERREYLKKLKKERAELKKKPRGSLRTAQDHDLDKAKGKNKKRWKEKKRATVTDYHFGEWDVFKTGPETSQDVFRPQGASRGRGSSRVSSILWHLHS